MQRAKGAAIECTRCGHANRPAVHFCTHCGLPARRSRFPVREASVVLVTIGLAVALAAYQLWFDHAAAVRPAERQTAPAAVAQADIAAEPPAADPAPQPAAAPVPADEPSHAQPSSRAPAAPVPESAPLHEAPLAQPLPEPVPSDPGEVSAAPAPLAGVDPLLDPLDDAPRSLPEPLTPGRARPAPPAPAKPAVAGPRRPAPIAASSPSRTRAPEPTDARDRAGKRVAAESTRARPDWYRALRGALAACESDPLLARIVCRESAKLRHCTPANAWGQVAECPRARVSDATNFN